MRTLGDLCGLTVRGETTYGVIGADAGAYAGTTLTLDDGTEGTTEETWGCGKRIPEKVRYTGLSTGFSATFNHVEGQGWEKWIERAVGSLSGVQRTTPSFSTAVRVSPSEVHLWTGCRVNTLGISATGIGAKLEFSVDTMARWHTLTPFKDSDGDTLEMDTVAIPVGIPVRYTNLWEYSTDGSQFHKINGKSWNFQIQQNLQGDPGASDEGTADLVQLEAGAGSQAQASSITLTITITSTDDTWDQLRASRTTGMTFRTVIDGKTVTLKGCVLDLGGPSRSQGTYDEPIVVTALDISVTG